MGSMFEVISPTTPVFVWRQGETADAPAGPGTALPRRRFEIYGQPGVFVWGVRRPGAASVSASVTLPSASGTASAGTVSATGGASVSLASAAATSAAGTISAQAGGNASTTLPSASATASAGTISASGTSGGSVAVMLAGVSATGSAGTITATATRSASVTLPSALATGAVGVIYVGALAPARPSAPPIGHGPALATRTPPALRRRAPNLSTRTR